MLSARTSFLACVRRGLKIAAGKGFPVSQQLPHLIRVPFIFIIAERMSEFVTDGDIEKLVDAHIPFQQQFAASPRHLGHERLFDERFALRIKRKRGAVWIKSSWQQNGLPIGRTHQDPGPIPEVRGGVFGKSYFQ